MKAVFTSLILLLFFSCRITNNTPNDTFIGNYDFPEEVKVLTVTSETESSSESKIIYFVEFGKWPQTIKDNSVTIDETVFKTVGLFTYYRGDDNEWYCKRKENANYSDHKYSNGTFINTSSSNSEKYFKVEPIKWRLLTNNYNGKKLLLAENALMNCIQFYEKPDTPNNYETSKIRSFLNGLDGIYENKGFLQTAFTENEQSIISTTLIDNSAASTVSKVYTFEDSEKYACKNTYDKIFLLSVSEAENAQYGHAGYSPKFETDYTMTNNVHNIGWWVRSPIYSVQETKKEEPKRDLAKDIASDTSGDYDKALLSMAKGDRSEELQVNDDLSEPETIPQYYHGEGTNSLVGIVPALCLD
ncbi:MAG: hypothetical protein IJR49_03675 [Treponema sp.]|nr:hypothetical protein [Treponema sp.]